MKLLIVANDSQKEELLTATIAEDLQIEWVAEPNEVEAGQSFDACMDLLFENNAARIALLQQVHSPVMMINSVDITLKEIPADSVRFNGWTSFLGRPVLEASSDNGSFKETANQVMERFGKRIEWVADIPGFITARVIASVINEAYFALEEKVSSKTEIDTAMKLGTNYPYGPFEWSERIGVRNVYSLLLRLAELQNRYAPSALLSKEALA